MVFVAGFYGLYFSGIFDVDPTPRPPPAVGKIAMVFASLPLPWHTDLVEDQRLGGGIAWEQAKSRSLW